jgi:hypothetical protein
MLDPPFKDLNLVGDYVGHALVFEIDVAHDTQFLPLTLKISYQKLHGGRVHLQVLCRKLQDITFVFKVGISKEDICLEQVSVFFIICRTL